MKKALQIRSADDVGPLYHMSLDSGIKKFVPTVTRRTGPKENTSIPRISTAPSILGCFVGYAKSWGDIHWPDTSNKRFKNGWYLYDIPYDLCLKPSLKELYDQELSDEHWLVTYNEQTRSYQGRIVAKMFYTEMTLIPTTGKYPRRKIKLAVEVFGGSVVFSKEHTLTQGYWMIEGEDPDMIDSWDTPDSHTVRKLSPGEYFKLKGLSAELLSLPPALNW